MYLGEWGEALRLTREGIRLAQNNGHATGETVLRLIEARMHFEAQDFAGAREAARKTVPLARPGFPLFATQLALSEADTGLGQYEAASAGFEEILESSRKGPFRLDWIFHLPLYRSLGELAFHRGDFANACSAADRLCALAALPGERTFLALGKNLLARIALAQNNPDQAAAHSAGALAALADADAPLAAWRVYETAAELALRLGRASEADTWLSQSVSTLSRLAGSMDTAEPLREALLALRGRLLPLRKKAAEAP